ncbi:uncharacterized protein LOC126595103 isoform X2 [Malus sylvestris]|uniref:uncharacterized protein LOC126595103 isoform X2 n=1 Tax=Malus sylvestris TaxID=3752 RepID=UPI0021ABD5FF|nr:uncharacterized protein LOC126595103 isoform X2 [Malus sylvestris]
MFEAYVLHLLRRYLGEYVHGLSVEALRISVWQGDVVLKDLKLKAEALNSLKLPVTVKAGFIGTITLKVPWKSLGKEPVIVLIDRVFILAYPLTDGQNLKEDREKLFEVKLQQIEETEAATLEAMSKSKLGSPPPGNSWLGSLIATIIGNLKISISNVHVRYEDSTSNPGHPFCSGVTLAKLAAVTMDEQGNETFDTSGALDKLRKSLQLERLAMYHDSGSVPWKIDKGWEDLTPEEWIQIFEDGINEPAAAANRKYLVSPINGVLKYHRIGDQERNDSEVPFEKASLVLSDVSLTVIEAQYYDWIKLLEVVSRYKTYVVVSHLRPVVPVSEGPYLWWHYATKASLQQKKMCYRFSWDRIRDLCQLRRRYIQLYAGSLQHLSNVKNAEIREIERDLDPKVILLWRLLAHAKVESVKTKEAAEQRSFQNQSWFSFMWRTPAEDSAIVDDSEGSQLAEERLTKEEWQAIHKLLSYQPEEAHSGKGMQNMIRFLVTVSVDQAAARIIDTNQTEVVCCRFEQLQISTKFKNRSTYCDVSLKFYGLSAPEGSLAQSVCSQQKVNALAASFVHCPVGENVDWRLSATISPCHVTVLMESFHRFLEFVKRSNAVSPTVTLETATALQMKIEQVTRRAQEQFQMVLEEQSRFALDIDLDAPKVRVPIRTCGSSKCDSHFLLDFGHFTLHTKDSQHGEQRQNLYSRFFITGRDIAAFFVDCGSDCQSCTLDVPDYDYHPLLSPTPDNVENCYSLIDRCGMAVLVDQIIVPHPSYPSMRISIQVPNLGIHFSPSRFQRLMKLLNIFCGTLETCNAGQPALDDFQAETPWSLSDLSTEARILAWRGIGNSVATWQLCYLVLSGINLYVLESEKSQSHQRHTSMAGRQVYEVPPANIGGSLFCVAVSYRGMDNQKALESPTTLIIEFRAEHEKAIWLKGLIQATYLASAPPSVNVLGETSDPVTDYDETQTMNSKTADLVINGALVETKIFIYGKTGDKVDEERCETLILEVLANGGKLHMIRWEGDLTLKMKLHSLKIKDELQVRLLTTPQYLACSVLNIDDLVSSPGIVDPHMKEMSALLHEDDDTFTDALPDFMSNSDTGLGSQIMDMDTCATTEDVNDDTGFATPQAIIHEKKLVKEKVISGEIFYEADGGDNSNFVSVTFLTRSPSSPDYDGIDTQMNLRMSKLEFFCNRPTLVALIDFGLDLSCVYDMEGSADMTKVPDDKPLMNKEKNEESVKGLLGYGKGRVVFYLNMNIDNVTVFLNKEDGSSFAMFVQESFLLDLKVHPSSLSIEGTLGNFRLHDMSLGTDHCWAWLCDIRNPGVESLIKFKFNSYSAEDDDYEGYDYSLCGRLSAVRIIFLYRFVQEITEYFMELATPHTEEAIKLVDKVGGFEWLIQKYEIDGATALKLDLSLDTPIIIVPRNSTSKDFIQLDLGQLKVTNEFSWYGSPEKDPSAVHIDVLHAEILGISMSVGIDGCLGKSMIREGKGLDVYVRRSLRDVFKKVPTFALEVKVGLLHGVMSDKEYKVILDCACMNLCEEPKLPPSFRGGKSGSMDTMRLLADKVNMNSQLLLSKTVTIVAVVIDNALLELYNGIHAESPLAQIAIEGLWVMYRMTSLSETDLYITIPKFSVVDIRPNTKPEMRLMLGSSADDSKQVSSGSLPLSLNKGSFRKTDSDAGFSHVDLPISTMFLMDYRWRKSSQSFVVRVQQPRVLVVADFLLAVGEFFVPALRTITGREEVMDPTNDLIGKSCSIVFSGPIYKQIEDVVHLSPSRQLVADCLHIDEYIYDGCGKTIHLSEETDTKYLHSTRPHPIIIIGCGKKLRFMNVKIENGSILRKYTHLSNDSSYSLSFEDGVDITLLDSYSSDEDKKSLEDTHKSSDTSNISSDSESDPNVIPSFSFEAQVVSPEFTFYDSSKSCLDDSYGEKLLRAKLDFSFMYASKENDTWVRALVKDLTVEAGSGLIVLDPVDISGGYTSVKDKTNMSLLSTDVCFHLSLSVVSLILNLQTQATSALQFGNSMPLAGCTNFDRIWVSPKENGSCYNLTFWRPRAPSNYVILGDCVTSRPVPPSQAVMAVSNAYGRVRQPIGFNLIGLFSTIQGFGGGDSDVGSDCSLWMPVAPPGYIALGCLANIGKEQPPNHIVYCLRSDLVTSTTYSECLFSSPSNPHFASGFSIWRVENVLGSFHAHSSTECPSEDNCCNLNHLLLWNWNRQQSGPTESASNLAVDNKYASHQTRNQTGNSSRWDIVRSISKANNCFMSTPNFERIWWDKGSDLRQPVSIWRPIARCGYAILGDCITEGLEPPAVGIIFKADDPEVSVKPVQFTKVAHIVGKGFDEVFFWYPLAPPGYASLGCIVSRTGEAPCVDIICCPRMDFVNQANILEAPISRSSTSKGSQCWSVWRVENQASTLLARADLKKPSSRLAYAIGDSLKPKTRENITAEVKLRCFSLTVLDSLCGMMKPLFDTTITNIKLATHGRLEAMNAVLISSIAASTFNTQLEAWEPLVEPFDGIFKFETYDTNVHSPSKFGKTVRIAATSILNLNVSAANLETFIGSVLSWKRQLELEQKAMKINEEAGGLCGQGEDQTLFALDEDDFQTVIVENKLGCEIYVKRVEENSDRVDRLHHGDYISIWVPPPRFSDRLNVVDESKEARYYVAIQIHKAKDLPIIDDGNSHNFFCALRLVVDSQATDQQKLFPQSARTKCVKPAVSEFNNLYEGTAEWNELFIFEVPRKGPAKVEVELTNLAAKAGKGEVVGALSFSVGQGANVLRKMASVRVFHQGHDVQNVVSHPLRGRVRHNSTEDMDECGCLLVSTSYFERKTTPSFQRDLEAENVTDRDIGFSVGLGPDGVWQNIRSLLPLSVVPKWLQNDFMALEVVVKNGKKHAIFRGLATVVNETDVKLKISVCHASRIQGRDSSLRRSDSINPGSSFILPWRSTSSDSDQCLQICPSVDHPQPPYSWGSLAAVGTGYTYGKDLTIIDQVSLSRQYTSKQENNLQNVTFKLNQLEKKDILLCCTSTINKQFWLSVGADASALHTELNAPVYDWKISVHSPMKLENRLSCPAEFTIWERTRDGKCVERQHGMISSRGGVHIYSADIQKPLYLTLFVEGGWVLEKDPVLLLNLYSNDHVSSFWMVHQKSKRRLRVSIEREMGGTTVAPKTIKFFVPYWITNDSSISLAYRVVEVEPSDNADTDSLMLSRAVKSATPALRSPTNSRDRKHSATRRNIQVLEVIEDTSPVPNMLSPQDYASRSGASLFPSQKDVYLSSRVGLSVAMHHSEIYSPGISLFELEKKERLDVKVFSSDGSYYKLSARLSMTSDRTKVRVDDYKWSAPFSVSSEGVMRVCLKKDDGNDQLQFRIAVRSGAKNSSYEVVFRPNSSISPYRIENRSMFLPIRIQQVDGTNDSWKVLLPNTAASFLWEDLGRRRLLEILVEGEDPLKSGKYDIDEISDHQPIHLGNVPSKALRVTVIKEEKVNVIKISDWMPEIDPSGILSTSHTSPLSQLSIQQQSPVIADCEFHVIIELAELGISIIDHTPEEILYLSVQNLVCAYSTGLGSGISRFKLRMRGIQLDNQLPLSPTPVLFRPQKVGDDTDYILKVSITMQSNGSLDLCVYPYIGLQGPENSAFLVNIHEPIIWRLHEMIQQVNLSRLSDTQTTAVSVDPIIEIGVLSISEVRFKVSMAMSPSQRPRGVLGFWASLMTALGNTENMPVRIYQKFNENVCMRQSSMISIAISNAQKDLLGQPLQLLSGVDILGNASSALGHMSKGMAALSFDKKFIQSRQRKESKGVEDFGDVLREGGGALAKGLFRGVTGILTKPLEGAKNSGVEGFVQGVGKGLIGAAAQPVSGVLDLLSKTTEGANAMRMKIASAITSDEQLLRKRLPRVIGGDNLIRPYDGYKAQGQAILQLAESGSFFLQVDLFKVRGKFALSDAYEDHSLLRKGKILLVTHRRAILLQQPFNVAQKKFNPARDPCSVLWDVLWDDLVIMEKSYGKKDHPKSPPSRVILYLQDKSEMKEHVRIIKCLRDTPQALDVYSSIERAMNTYGPNKPKQMLKKSMTLPYAPFVDNTSAEATSKEPGSPRQVPASIPRSSTFGSRFN